MMVLVGGGGSAYRDRGEGGDGDDCMVELVRGSHVSDQVSQQVVVAVLPFTPAHHSTTLLPGGVQDAQD
jgi:hypothetical protein